jgi:hypothetical protein
LTSDFRLQTLTFKVRVFYLQALTSQAHVPSRHGRGDRAAVSRRHGAGADGDAKTAANRGAALRAVYIPNGAIMDRWIPEKVGCSSSLPILKPLERFKESVVVTT